MYYIYCYTNKINNHKYVGQTNDLKRRNKEHKSNSYNEKSCSYNSLFHKKIREYGWDNFELSVLEIIYENDQDIINEKEIYWIDKLKTFRGTGLGYNSDKGGSQKKECKVLTPEELVLVKKDIKDGKSFLDISSKYHISAGFISSINHGVYWRDENETYPLYKYYKDDTDYDELIQLLTESDLTFKQIANQLDIGESTVKKINYGTLRKNLYPTHPIRKITPQKRKANKIKELLLTTNLSKKEISTMVGVSLETIRCINIGETYYDKNLHYPLRNACNDYSSKGK